MERTQIKPKTSHSPPITNFVQRKCACGKAADLMGECRDCKKDRLLPLQAKLHINRPNDFHEREADSIAQKVLHTVPQAPVHVTPVRPSVQTVSNEAATPQADVSSRVQSVLNSAGRPLGEDTKLFMESRFGHDFSRVRVHTDVLAAQSAQDLGAQAYTSGHHIVFGNGQYFPSTQKGKKLLTHELVHVLQQNQQPGSVQRQIIQRRVTKKCRALLSTPGASTSLLGGAVHAAIRSDFSSRVGSLWPHNIPTGSATPFRTEGRPGDDSVIDPQIIGGRAGFGVPDLAYKKNKKVELAEIKPGNWGGLAFATAQLGNYITKGMSEENEDFRREHSVRLFAPMTNRRYMPPALIPVAGQMIRTVWCGPGIILYKPVKKKKSKKKDKKKSKKKTKTKAKAKPKVKAKPKGKVGKKILGKVAGRALVYAEVAAAIYLLASGKAEASIGGEGSSPLEALYEAMQQKGQPVPPEIKAMIEEDEELKTLIAELPQGADVTELQEAFSERITQMIQENPEDFSAEDLKVLLSSTGAATPDEALTLPESREELRKVIEKAQQAKGTASSEETEISDAPSQETQSSKKGRSQEGTQSTGTGQETAVTLNQDLSRVLDANQAAKHLVDAVKAEQGLEAVNDENVRRILEAIKDLDETQLQKMQDKLASLREEQDEENTLDAVSMIEKLASDLKLETTEASSSEPVPVVQDSGSRAPSSEEIKRIKQVYRKFREKIENSDELLRILSIEPRRSKFEDIEVGDKGSGVYLRHLSSGVVGSVVSADVSQKITDTSKDFAISSSTQFVDMKGVLQPNVSSPIGTTITVNKK